MGQAKADILSLLAELSSKAESILDSGNIMLSPEKTGKVDLQTFLELCEDFQAEPRKMWNSFYFYVKPSDRVQIYVSTDVIPELTAREEPKMLDLIKSILSDRKANAKAA